MTNIVPGPSGDLPTPGRAAPPHPLDAQWHIHTDGQTFGPYSGHQLLEYAKEGRINGTTQVVAVGEEKWVRAGEEPRLAAIFRTQPASPPPISAAAGATVVHVTNQVNAAPAFLMMEDGTIGPKSPGIALLCSFLLCGGGQMYCGRVGKGFLMLFGCIVLWFILLGWIIQIWSMIDAYSTAKNMNQRYLMRMQAMQPR